MFWLGIDLGGTNIAVGIVNQDGILMAKESVKTLAYRHYSEIIADMATTSKKLCKANNIPLSDLAGIGIGSPGMINSKKGIVVYSNNMNFENVPMKEELQKHIQLPVFMSNDANCAALGETIAGAAKGHKNVVMLTLGTGVGGGVIIDGKIYEGEYSAGAELGHTVIVVDGELCTCGRHGCLEAYASATALIRQTKAAIEQNSETLMQELIKQNNGKVSGKTAFQAAKQGDALASDVVNNYIKYLSEGVVNMVNIFRPEVVIVGGGVCNEGDYLLNPIRNFVAKNAFGGNRVPVPKVVSAQLGNDAGIIGAAMLVK